MKNKANSQARQPRTEGLSCKTNPIPAGRQGRGLSPRRGCSRPDPGRRPASPRMHGRLCKTKPISGDRGPYTTTYGERGRSPCCAKQSQPWGRWGIWVGDGECHVHREGPTPASTKGMASPRSGWPTMQNKANWLWKTRPRRPCHAGDGRLCKTKPICGDGWLAQATPLVWRGRWL